VNKFFEERSVNTKSSGGAEGAMCKCDLRQHATLAIAFDGELGRAIRSGGHSGRQTSTTAAAAAAAAGDATDAAAILARSVDRELLLWTFDNAPDTPPSAAARREVSVDE